MQYFAHSLSAAVILVVGGGGGCQFYFLQPVEVVVVHSQQVIHTSSHVALGIVGVGFGACAAAAYISVGNVVVGGGYIHIAGPAAATSGGVFHLQHIAHRVVGISLSVAAHGTGVGR